MENSKPQWIRLGEALTLCNSASGDEEEWLEYLCAENKQTHPQQWEYQNHLNVCLSSAGLSGVLTFRGVKASRPDRSAHRGADYGSREKVPPEYFCTTHIFQPQKDVIEWHTGNEEYEDQFHIVAKRSEGSGQYPMWTNVIVERTAFEAWLPTWLRKWLAEAVRHGWRTPEEAALMQAADPLHADSAAPAKAPPIKARTPARDIAKMAINALWPSGIPPLRDGERDRTVIAWCKQQQPPLTPPSSRTIRRVSRQ